MCFPSVATLTAEGERGGRGEERGKGRERVGVDITKSKMSNQPSFVALCTYTRKGLGSPH